MRKTLGMLALCLTVASAAFANEWNIDVSHSAVMFKVKHLVVSTVPGTFSDFTGKVNFDGANWDQASVTVTAKAASISTGNEDRDKHLRSGDFFAADSFPDVTFSSKKVIKGSGDSFQLIGDLTMRGITKEVTFDCTFNGLVDDPWGNQRAGFEARATVNRQDFGIKWSKAIDSGGLVVGDDVKVEISIEAVRKKA